MSEVEVHGYSERGMINAMTYEMRWSPNGIELLRSFLGRVVFPQQQPDFGSFESAKIRVEQSFSDFGDLDLLILLEGNQNQAILLEAKVKTTQATRWSIDDEWKEGAEVLRKDGRRSGATSNLFVQLYRKMRLVHQGRSLDTPLERDDIPTRCSLGKNAVVIRAVRELAQYCSQAWLVALVPDTTENVARFFSKTLPASLPSLPDWSTAHLGYLTWSDWEKHCREHASELPVTLSNFDYNNGQIYDSSQLAASRKPSASDLLPLPPAGAKVQWHSPNGSEVAVVKRRGKFNTRIVVGRGDGKTEIVVPNADLTW